MTENENRIFLESDEYRVWARLHHRVIAGEILTSVEREQYSAIVERLDADESRSFSEAAQQRRNEHAALEAENRRLRKQYKALDTQIAELEKRLSQQTKVGQI